MLLLLALSLGLLNRVPLVIFNSKRGVSPNRMPVYLFLPRHLRDSTKGRGYLLLILAFLLTGTLGVL